jgi:DNA-binding CsgD family transcriptional regulator
MADRRTWIRLALVYGGALAGMTFLLTWLDYKHLVRDWTTELYILCIALLFAIVGAWLGNRLTVRPRPEMFERNDRTLAALGISARESEVLDLLAEGCSNKVIARRLDISPNTVKTHVSRLFEKLEAGSRTEAIRKARSLSILP